MESVFLPFLLVLSFIPTLAGLAMVFAAICGFIACYVAIALDAGHFVARTAAGRRGAVGLVAILISLVAGFLWEANLLGGFLVSLWFFAPMLRWLLLNQSKNNSSGWSMNEIRYSWLLGMVTSGHLVCSLLFFLTFSSYCSFHD